MKPQLENMLFTLVLTGCAASAPATLVGARTAYHRAAAGPAARVAPAQLHAAQTSLETAEQTFADEGASDDARDRAYVAQRKAELAEVQARIMVDDERTARASARVQAANAANQLALQRDLSSANSQIARDQNVVASQQAQLQSETQRRQRAERAAADALSALANIASIKEDARGTVITLSGAVIFASGKADLLAGAHAKLDQVATALNQGDSQSKIEIDGYTDSRGSAALNDELSTHRAQSVSNYLSSKGVSTSRIVVKGLGPSSPVADNETAEGRADNRRVEIVVQKGEQVASQP